MQRVTGARVLVGEEQVSRIGSGLAVLVGIKKGDGEADLEYMADKIARLRIFEDEDGKMNLSVMECGRKVLLVSQFTLYGDVRKGRRPSFSEAAPPEEGLAVFNRLAEKLKNVGLDVQTGRFGAHMTLEIKNDGPCTVVLDSGRVF